MTTGTDGRSFLHDVASQPDALRRAAGALGEQVGPLDAVRAAWIDRPRARLLLTGMGSSYHACYAPGAALGERGVLAAMVDSAELLHFRLEALDAETLVVAVTQSGRSVEVVKLLDHLAGRAAPRPYVVSVTNGLDNPVSELADAALDTRAGPEGGVSTRTFGASLVVLAAVAAVIAGDDARTAVDAVSRDAMRAAEAADATLGDPEATAERLRGWLGDRSTLILAARGTARAASETGALTLKEAARFPAEALESAQFRHGPLELAGPDMAAVVMATEPATRHLEIALAGDLAGAGAAVLAVAPDPDLPDGVTAMAIGEVARTLSAAVAVIPAQLLAWRVAIDRGRTPGRFTRATKVTTRE